MMYGYDKKKNRCVIFFYNGKGGNPNRFKHEYECIKTCGARSSGRSWEENKTPMPKEKTTTEITTTTTTDPTTGPIAGLIAGLNTQPTTSEHEDNKDGDENKKGDKNGHGKTEGRNGDDRKRDKNGDGKIGDGNGDNKKGGKDADGKTGGGKGDNKKGDKSGDGRIGGGKGRQQKRRQKWGRQNRRQQDDYDDGKVPLLHKWCHPALTYFS
ncbi:Kunitz/Bovine pancreatic trypsin inhibitor domain protein [Ancylostoma duodenale]|uniref:Kunitz/Bovine pancreatic trypsin inhibitor domain protein n=1 Tax=Ancylostoma duodenale TaxID=51022 RepID=A0A0C2GWS9_9BILA|nr:Kunitz/Bovine pancreatic trypsin inhibitor domain protein [Ancylostoma duodenale]